MTSDTPPATTAPLTRAQQAEVERQHALIMRGTRFGDAETRATMERELRARLAVSLQDERPLRVYFGVDPTAPDLHLGHCVPLRKLRTFQQLGHHAILLIGDFTAQIGDASDKDALRPMHAAEVIAANARTYQEQAFKLLDREQTEVVHNADWLGALTFQDVVRLASHFTVAQFIERDNFRKRLDRGEPVYVHEFMYGLMQGYDAVELRADVQVGGTEQTFNIMAGRTLQRAQAQAPQVAITSPILVGLDGKDRMSKSAGNHIGIDEPPGEQYGKAMSIPDDALIEFYTLGTNLEPDEVDGIVRDLADGSLHPMAAKKRLAHANRRRVARRRGGRGRGGRIHARLLTGQATGGDAGGGRRVRGRRGQCRARGAAHPRRHRGEQGRSQAPDQWRLDPARRRTRDRAGGHGDPGERAESRQAALAAGGRGGLARALAGWRGETRVDGGRCEAGREVALDDVRVRLEGERRQRLAEGVPAHINDVVHVGPQLPRRCASQ